ncbi:glucosylceramidase [Bacteroides salyersiae]|jgi:hypothetical protein|uniref:glycoside hydrolase family 30 protein n=2 Tax=Bacteroides salyersiae TaxID=291644 RepID=UPI00125E0143|nr:glycoside hydrolase family 30 beta sandwich domain-containing protein [Bacteroides salyersiae]KAB5344977.1 glucosylceramidase [Bacteroides salyersiae]KAB5353861.1 glucosylceramidase [Bacteroides salyersiae]KAB5366122.1 glucosylceramidase [Bacteroides salyersiae]KAB5373815.1 glucosylceramidase [Bacteroides salyersiae]KAB5374304.1 glucosylceramidase [Bacteroides salyersiae]
MSSIKRLFAVIVVLFLFVGINIAKGTEADRVSIYTTSADQSRLFHHSSTSVSKKTEKRPDIKLQPQLTYQEIDGFGAAITGSTAYNLLQMTPEDRTAFLKEVFDSQSGLGYSYIRISIGCSDFSLSEYTCCDTPGIENFSLQPEDTLYVIPILKEILSIHPAIKIMASPWTAPRWMKVENLETRKPYDSWTSGQLNPEYYADYALYFVKYIQSMKAAGIDITTVTIQNEPLNRGNSTSMYMTWQEQRDFIKSALGPAFEEFGIESKIVVFDHNFNYDEIRDQEQYPLRIYEDTAAAQYIDGAAYHAYGGRSSELDLIHRSRPDKNLYFTEMSIGDWNPLFEDDLMWFMSEVGIGTLIRWNKAIIVWNLMLDAGHGPNRPGGCLQCYGAVDIGEDYKTLKRNSHYYLIGHLSKVIKPGAIRIGVSEFDNKGIEYVAFKNPDASYGVVLLNRSNEDRELLIGDEKESLEVSVPSRSIVSLSW